MRRGMLGGVVTSILALAAAVAPLRAQFSWPYDPPARSEQGEPPAPPPQSHPTPGSPTGKSAPAASGPAIAGKWNGQLTQIGGRMPYKVELAISATSAETKYPDLDCAGKLIRVGASKSYVFFIEVITKGAASKGGRCPDGTVTVARSGSKLALLWFGNIDGDTIIAYGTLSK
jgi:hypothetical protein